MKKGFTLVELLVVIVIIGALATLVLPGLLSNYNKGIKKIMKTQENLINDAAALAIQDYCNNPISKEKQKLCKFGQDEHGKDQGLIRPNSSASDYTPLKFDFGDGNGEVEYFYVCLKDLRNEGFYENELVYENRRCFSATRFIKENGKYVKPKTYIYCYSDSVWDDDDDSVYKTDKHVPHNKFPNCYEAPEEI